MKYLLIGFAVWLVVAWLPHFIKAWITDIRIWWAKKHASRGEKWMYE